MEKENKDEGEGEEEGGREEEGEGRGGVHRYLKFCGGWAFRRWRRLPLFVWWSC